jgi:general secretion pathway protein A
MAVAAAAALTFAVALVMVVGGHRPLVSVGRPAQQVAAAAAPVTTTPIPAPAQPPAAAPPPPPPTVSEFLAGHATDTGTDTAFGHLFTLWDAAFDPKASRPCEQAEAAGLACLAGTGSFAQLRLLNRPAILSLVTADGTEHQVVLAALNDKTGTIVAGGATLDADLLDLQRWWFGQYLLLWHPPVPMHQLIKPGMRGPEVRWLRQSLAVTRGETARATADTYDKALGSEVEDFQRRHHLTVDGIAGEQTLVMLDAQLAVPGSPTLQAGGSN